MANQYIAPSTSDTGTAGAPGAGADLVVLSNLKPGRYEVDITIALDGTAETQKANLQLTRSFPSATVLTDLPTISAQVIQVTHIVEIVDATDDLTVEAIAAATAGSIYTVHVAAHRIS